MAGWEQAYWEADVSEGLLRRDRASGPYRRYVPDRFAGLPLLVEPTLAQQAADAERGIRALNGAGGDALAAVSRFLLRSEAIASSQIEEGLRTGWWWSSSSVPRLGLPAGR